MTARRSPGGTSAERFAAEAVRAMRDEIASCGGREVFFLCRTGAEGTITDVQTLARGNDEAVPAVIETAGPGDVVVHNHPNGILSPSDSDLGVAGRLGGTGVGFFIVDNEVERVYAVVEPRRPEEAPEPLDPEAIAALLDGGGPLMAAHPNYEVRPSQCRMAAEVARVLEEKGVGLFEAGTGTGKSLAYLLPSLLWAVQGRRRVVVATRTINLQEQLLRQDLPLAQEVLGVPFKAVLVKGRGNYLCLRKRDLLEGDAADVLLEHDDSRETRQILDWSRVTKDGTLSDLPLIPRESNWELFRSESDSCLRARCQHFSDCFFYRARLEAASAHVLLANHSVLFADLGLRSAGSDAAAIMPRYDAVVLDEAHNVEEVAISFFDGSVGRWGLAGLLGRLVSRRRPDRGLVPHLLALAARRGRLSDAARRDLAELGRATADAVEQVRSRVDGVFDDLAQILAAWLTPTRDADVASAGKRRSRARAETGDGEGEGRWRIPAERRGDPEWGRMGELLGELLELLGSVLNPLRRLNRRLGDLVDEGSQELAGAWADLGASAMRIEGARDFTRRVIEGGEGTEVLWAQVRSSQGRPGVILHLTPTEAAEILEGTLYSLKVPVVMTSATLTVGGSFDFINERLGIDRILDRAVSARVFPTSFDMAQQMRLLLLDDIPEPGRPGFVESLTVAVAGMVRASGGGTLVLFTSYRTMDRVFEGVCASLSGTGVLLLRQGEAPRTPLLERFRDDPNSVLFATDSFWEGVDVVGSSLRSLIIARLPFPVPTDPVNEARAEALARMGKDPFLADSVPRAVIRLRQGLGRLIRHRDDRGFAVICDSRLVRRPYGRIFLDSLPDLDPRRGRVDEVTEEMRRFFGGVDFSTEGRL